MDAAAAAAAAPGGGGGDAAAAAGKVALLPPLPDLEFAIHISDRPKVSSDSDATATACHCLGLYCSHTTVGLLHVLYCLFVLPSISGLIFQT